jgi:phenylalanyl-tRNA synthetase beta chain
LVGITSGGDYLAVKGAIEGLLAALNPRAVLEVRPTRQELLDPVRSAELHVRLPNTDARLLGYLGQANPAALKRFELRAPTTVAELKLGALDEIAELVPQYVEPPVFPAVSRDLNLVVDESVTWGDLQKTVTAAAAPYVESLRFQDVYRDQKRLGPGKKSLLLTLVLRSAGGTLTNEEADQIRARVVEACQRGHGAQLRS